MNRITKMASHDIGTALKLVMSKIEVACAGSKNQVRLVAVSKTKPLDSIVAAYVAGQRHFGENYVQELEEKARNDFILSNCPDIKWHFIGRLQSNKAQKVLQLPHLHMLETISSKKLAKRCDQIWEKLNNETPLPIMVQVNTSDEPQKGGCLPEEVTDVVNYIKQECPRLKFVGLMTIGALNHNIEDGPNLDFLCLKNCQESVAQSLDIERESIELSMGMSHDYEHAIELGSTNVRVGSTIFGAREYKPPSQPEESSSTS